MSLFSSKLTHLQDLAGEVAESAIAPLASEVDEKCIWPEHSLRALADAGLLGLQVPQELGGHGEGLLALALLTETIATACPSSALCFGMHNVGTAVIAAKATDYHKETYLKPIAQGRHITTLALSEKGSGAYLYLPETRAKKNGDTLAVNGSKLFVTNGGHADSYVLSVLGPDEPESQGDFSCLLLDGDTAGIEWQDEWHGLGMRGNSSCGLRLDKVTLPYHNLLGSTGEQIWYVFEVIAPYFLVAMAGTYLGVAQAALNIAREHLLGRRYGHSGKRLAEFDVPQTRLAELWIKVEQTRALVHTACNKGDMGAKDMLPFILACKASASETAVSATNEAMTLCGGSAYRDNSKLAQLLRDARASHVMTPTTDLLKLWMARSLLGLPLL